MILEGVCLTTRSDPWHVGVLMQLIYTGTSSGRSISSGRASELLRLRTLASERGHSRWSTWFPLFAGAHLAFFADRPGTVDPERYPKHPRSFRTAEEMLDALGKIYGDKNRKNRAMVELRTLRMARRPFDDFYADFTRCAAEIGYSDDALIPLLENAFSNELTRQVYDLVDVYREIDHQIRDYGKRVVNRFKV
ncbi:hypothetical protein V500_04983 [Pseudogymnoascus sp. VKM F-4518 (FW-2643)]|nr:hypothetical protein V500_04983 [Pseudogymnoascus sp. VKM F-4518 (FW-2643)]